MLELTKLSSRIITIPPAGAACDVQAWPDAGPRGEDQYRLSFLLSFLAFFARTPRPLSTFHNTCCWQGRARIRRALLAGFGGGVRGEGMTWPDAAPTVITLCSREIRAFFF